jgi:glycosyltransferase involved in cell wall biosynthesis
MTPADRKLSILFVGPLPPHQGGAAIFSEQILAALARRGHAIEAISPITEAALQDGDRFAERHPDLNVTRFVLPYLLTGPDIPASAEYRRSEATVIGELVAQALEHRRPDIVIAGREAIAPYLEGASHLRRLLVIHGTTMFGIARGSYPRELAEPLLATMRQFDLILTSGRHAQRSMAELSVPGVRVIPNPVDTDCFRPLDRPRELRRQLGLGDSDIAVLHASKLTEQKRPMDILGAAEQALRHESRLMFVVAGEGRCREQVQRECAARGLDRRFRFPGWIAHERMPELINGAEMVVMPSAYECQALVYLETMACGRPLIASDIPASREVVQHGVSGLLHPEGDEAALAAAILACAHDSRLTARLVAEGRSEAKRHALPVILDAYERALTELAFGRRPASTPSSA